ncbi:MAG: hypothetical protein QOC72_252 [Methylobacteriaceae bacterium]|nr:hypothetical protein [Methylobacteriaceae bacterium]
MSFSSAIPFLGKERDSSWRTRLLQPVAVALTVAAIVVLCAVSPLTLAIYGVDYDAAGGSALAKIHPGTYLAVMALAARLCAAPHPWRTLQRLLLTEPGLLIYLAALGLLALYVVAIARTPVTPLIDTFLLALILTMLVEGLDERIARLLAILLVAILAIDALLAIAEVSTGWRLIHISVPEGVTSDPTRTDLVFDWRADLATDWRATALFGHPLENAMLMGAFLICLASAGTAWLGKGLRLALGVLAVLAMFAFGGRASMVFSGVFLLLLGLGGVARRLTEGRAFSLRAAGAILLALPLIGIGLAVIGETSLFERVAERFRADEGSALARLTMWSLFDPIPWRDLVLAPDQAVVKTWQRLQGLEFGIESFWLGFALTYGLIMSAVLIAGLAAFVVSVVRLSGKGALLVFLFYFAGASTSTSLSSKTTSFAILTAMILLVLRRENHSLPSRSGP